MNDNGIELNVDAESDFNEELEYAEMVTGILLQKIEEESVYLSKRREKVIEDRRYFSDYFSEMKEDERNELAPKRAFEY